MTDKGQPTGRVAGEKGEASVKQLKTAINASAYQREWFKDLQVRVANGEPFAYINADVPMEILRAMDIPFVVNQWWAALCSAKQMAPFLLGLLKEQGYREDICQYCATSLACALDPEPQNGPWGGLPKPTMSIARLSCDALGKIFEAFARQYNIPFYPIECSVPLTTPDKWWEKAPHRWEELYQPYRLDHAVKELEGYIKFLELTTGRMFRETNFEKVMDLVNQQEEYYTKTRDLIAKTVPAPVSITDTVPCVMISQWQRGTQWAVDSARLFYEEIADMVDRGVAVCKNERVRLMWLGRGLWFNLGFYQYFEQRYDAVFVWSMYLAMGADAYRRYGDGNQLRTLAARFLGMEDFLHMPPWNSEWFLKEAKANKIDAVVYLVPEGCMQAVEGSHFITKTLEDAGIPVLQLRADPVDARKWNQKTMTAAVEEFLEKRVGVKPND